MDRIEGMLREVVPGIWESVAPQVFIGPETPTSREPERVEEGPKDTVVLKSESTGQVIEIRMSKQCGNTLLLRVEKIDGREVGGGNVLELNVDAGLRLCPGINPEIKIPMDINRRLYVRSIDDCMYLRK